jgi:hypothetical protein
MAVALECDLARLNVAEVRISRKAVTAGDPAIGTAARARGLQDA